MSMKNKMDSNDSNALLKQTPLSENQKILCKKIFSTEIYNVEPEISRIAVLFKSHSADYEADPYKNLDLSDHGLATAVIHCMDFEYVNKDLLEKALKNYESYRGLILTSPRAIKAIDRAFQNDEDRTKYLSKWKKKLNYAVGKETGSSAGISLGIDETLGQESANSDNLVKCIIEESDSKEGFHLPYLFPCSKMRKNTLIEGLIHAGINVEEIICYSPVPRDFKDDWSNLHAILHELGKSDPDILVFFSPSAVKFVLRKLSSCDFEISKYHVVALGPSTGKELASVGVNPFICDEPSKDGLKKILKQLCTCSDSHKTEH